MGKDRIYAEKKGQVEPFRFNAEVTRVFDDMLNRSVPFYAEIQNRLVQLTESHYQDRSWIYDLGCSHGNLGVQITRKFKDKTFSMLAVDSSLPMIAKYASRLQAFKNAGSIHLVCGQMENIRIRNASVVLINLTLQFLDPEKRDALLRKIYQGLNPGGILILTEKIYHDLDMINQIQLSFYKRFKLENGYSELEISQKRDALEKILKPDTVDMHLKRIKQSGFSTADVWFKWFNFTSIMAIKN